MRKFWLILTVSIFAAGTKPQAQTSFFDAEQLAAECSASPASCQTHVANVLATLLSASLPANQLNTQLGVLASSVLHAAQATTTPTAARALASTLQDIAAASSDMAQANAIRIVASNVAKGQAKNIDVMTAFAASPA